MIRLEDFTKRNCIDPSYGLSGIPWQEALVTILARRGMTQDCQLSSAMVAQAL